MKPEKRNSSAAIHIARQHQSAPKQHWADAEVTKAAQEIDAGKWVPPTDGVALLDNLGIALHTGTSGVAIGERPTLEDFRRTRELNEIGRHPRVLEAMERMKLEVEQTVNPQERMEKEWMLYEMAELQVKKNKWEGQQRWEGKDNEAMRHGEILSPWEFTERLFAVIGLQRVFRGGNLYKEDPTKDAGVLGLYIQNPDWKGDKPLGDYPQLKAHELIETGKKELRKAQELRRAGHDAEADKKFNLVAEMGEAAGGLLIQPKYDAAVNPRYLRVATLQWPMMTEWMVMRFDEYGVPVNAKFLGWRTALLTMIRGGAITEAEAHQAFPVGSGPAGAWYREQLYRFRNPAAKRMMDIQPEDLELHEEGQQHWETEMPKETVQ